jgi:hypothetical protein
MRLTPAKKATYVGTFVVVTVVPTALSMWLAYWTFACVPRPDMDNGTALGASPIWLDVRRRGRRSSC